MKDLSEYFIFVALLYFFSSLIEVIYPNTKNKHSLMVVASIIIVYSSLTPLSGVIDTLKSAINKFEISNSAVSEIQYTDALIDTIEQQVKMEISEYLAGEGIKCKSVDVGVSHDNQIAVDYIKIEADTDSISLEEKISEFVESNYGVYPTFSK